MSKTRLTSSFRVISWNDDRVKRYVNGFQESFTIELGMFVFSFFQMENQNKNNFVGKIWQLLVSLEFRWIAEGAVKMEREECAKGAQRIVSSPRSHLIRYFRQINEEWCIHVS